jgi:L-threonylcarbamoyladenylate synthase
MQSVSHPNHSGSSSAYTDRYKPNRFSGHEPTYPILPLVPGEIRFHNNGMTTEVLATDTPELMKLATTRAVAALQAGEPVALPTETVYGLAADALNPEAVAKVFAAKERPSFDPLIVHLPHKDRLSDVAEIPQELTSTVRQLVERFWPGPLTLVLPKSSAVPDLVTSGLSTVAVRMSDHPVFKKIITSYGKPLAAPSANRFGRISPTSASAVMEELAGRIPLIVDGGACMHGLESTIIKLEAGPTKPIFRVLRAGPIIKEELQEIGKVIYEHTAALAQPDAPGQLASHYAPATPVRLLLSPAEFRPDPSKRYALLSYRGEDDDGYQELTDWAAVAVLSPGSGKLTEAAMRLFFCLRKLDEAGVDEIIAEPVTDKGLGMAIMDRLRRAAAKRPARV